MEYSPAFSKQSGQSDHSLKHGVLPRKMKSNSALPKERNIKMKMVIDWIKAGAKIVDVRSVGEYNMENYPGAVNIPLDQLEDRLAEFGAKDEKIVVHCASGGRSAMAKAYLNQLGYTQVVDGGGLYDMPAPADIQA
jgi:phage shock protein E